MGALLLVLLSLGAGAPAAEPAPAAPPEAAPEARGRAVLGPQLRTGA